MNIKYIALNKKTQIITPTQMGEMIYDVVSDSIRPLLNPALTASWEKGLAMVAQGEITSDEYMQKLTDFVTRRTNIVKQLNNQQVLYRQFEDSAKYYAKGSLLRREPFTNCGICGTISEKAGENGNHGLYFLR